MPKTPTDIKKEQEKQLKKASESAEIERAMTDAKHNKSQAALDRLSPLIPSNKKNTLENEKNAEKDAEEQRKKQADEINTTDPLEKDEEEKKRKQEIERIKREQKEDLFKEEEINYRAPPITHKSSESLVLHESESRSLEERSANNNNQQENALHTLGLSKDNASNDDIRRAYKELALKYHPDKNVGNEKEAAEKFKKVKEAYDYLKENPVMKPSEANGNKYTASGDTAEHDERQQNAQRSSPSLGLE